MVSAFLNHLEDARHNSVRTRNVRLTAIRSLCAYAGLRHPQHALLIQRLPVQWACTSPVREIRRGSSQADPLTA